MRTLPQKLRLLPSALLQVTARLPLADRANAEALIDPYVQSMHHRCGFAEVHGCVVLGIPWPEVNECGRRPSPSSQPNTVSIALREAQLILEHPSAVCDHAYMAFDGLVGAVANITDTLGRTLNACYGLGIPARQANLFKVRAGCTAGSALHRLLDDSARTEWLTKTRELRGRCQHADVVQVLQRRDSALGASVEPLVPAEYDWRAPPQDRELSDYSRELLSVGERFIVDCVEVIINDPLNAV